MTKLFSMVVVMSMVLTMWPLIGMEQKANAEGTEVIEVEAAPADNSIEVVGPRHTIMYIDESTEGKSDYIALFSHVYGEQITVPKFYVAVQVDNQNTVVKVVNPSVNGAPPVWETNEVVLSIPLGGFVLLAQDDSYSNKGFKKYLATNFQIGDSIKLRKSGEVVTLDKIISDGPKPGIQIDQLSMFTVNQNTTTISGKLVNHDPEQSYTLMVGNQTITTAETGEFETEITLVEGTNYIDTVLAREGEQAIVESTVIYYKSGPVKPNKEVLMWVDQAANAHKFQTSDEIYNMLVKAEDSGITGIILDVNGYEGFVSYKKNDLTNRPYVSNMSGPNRGGANPDLDLLEEFITHSHSLGLTIHAAVNVFAEGSMYENAVLDDHPDWEERVYRPEDNGNIVPIRESQASNKIVAFVNPANDEVRQFELDTFEEIMKNYDVDGINLDRGRYDNYFADFSEETRVKFETYLGERGKTLDAWPNDVYTLVYEENGQTTRVEGQHYIDWWAFRADTITTFTDELRVIVDNYSELNGKDIQMSTYVGSWYDSMYLNGINWASPNFRYNSRLGFTEDRIYTDDYYSTGYTDNLDFIMIGTYQNTDAEIEQHMTLGNVLTMGELPLYASIALSNIQEPELQREVLQSVIQKTDGMMLFEYSLINFDMIKAGLNDEVYVKPYQLGISIPGHSEQFFEGDYFNVNRNEDNINVYTPEFGRSTNTNHWGVEMAVDATGTVTETANKLQAINWNWTVIEDNDTLIPEGGFVISSADPSGVRVKRQFIANSFSIGDHVRAALLEGYLNYDGVTFDENQVEVEGTISILGHGEQLNVLINGKKAKINGNRANENGQKISTNELIKFTDKVKLEHGENQIVITVYVDGMKTNEKTFNMIFE